MFGTKEVHIITLHFSLSKRRLVTQLRMSAIQSCLEKSCNEIPVTCAALENSKNFML